MYQLDRKHTTMVLVVVLFASFMDSFDGCIVNICLPDIGKDFGVDTATVSWIAIIYMIVLAGTLVAFARVAVQIGIRKILFYGLAVFTAASFVCGISSSFYMLLVARAVQGVGAGMMGATASMCCVEFLPPEKLGLGLSLVTIGGCFGFALGPAIGGIIANYTTWDWIFFLNVPLGLIAAPLVLRAIPANTIEFKRTSFDMKGAILLLLAISFGVFAVEVLSYRSLRMISAVSGVLFLVFICLFVRAEAKTESPLLKLSLFRKFGFSSVFVCLMLMNLTYMGVTYLMPFFCEICMGLSSMEAGLLMCIASFITAAVGMPIARSSDMHGRRWYCTLAGAFLALAFVFSIVTVDGMAWSDFVIVMVFMGLSWGFVGGPMASRLVEQAEDEREMASSLTYEAYYVGAAIGEAVLAMVFTLASGTEGIDIGDVSQGAFLEGYVAALAVVTVLALAVVVLSAVLKDKE